MLRITVPETERWDSQREEFVYTKRQKLQLEHSLVSLSKWEARWNKPFLSREDKTTEEISDYVRCMTLTQNVPDEVYGCLSQENISQIEKYIEAPMTATTFSPDPAESGGRSIITAEIIYYWMVSFNIPFECQKWHLNRLLTLIKVCERKSRPARKRSQQEIAARNRSLNAQRRARLGSRG